MLSFESNGSVLNYDGNYTEFHDWKVETDAGSVRRSDAGRAERSDTVSVPGAIAAGVFDSSSADVQKPKTDPLSKNQRNQLEKRIKQIESELPALEAEAARLSAEMSDPGIASDYGRLAEITGKLTDTETRIKSLYEEWESATSDLG